MKSNRKGPGAYSVVTAAALVLGLAACDQIQSLWKSDEKANPAVGSVAQPKPAEGTIQVARAVDLPKSIETHKPPADENKLPAHKSKPPLGAAPAWQVHRIRARVPDAPCAVTGTAD